MRNELPPAADGIRARQCERVASPREDQGVVDSLALAFQVDRLPEDMRRLIARIR